MIGIQIPKFLIMSQSLKLKFQTSWSNFRSFRYTEALETNSDDPDKVPNIF